jgi:hypothetical protein
MLIMNCKNTASIELHFIRIIKILTVSTGFLCLPLSVWGVELPFMCGEKLTYELRWANIPAGEATLEVRSLKTIDGTSAYHFVMKAKSNKFVDIFYKVRDRIDAYANTEMTRSVYYKKNQSEGPHKKKERITFDWDNRKAQYTDFSKDRDPIKLLPGSFDPLSAFYFTRTAIVNGNKKLIERPVTDGKNNVIGRAKITKTETITLKNGRTFDTLRLEPEMRHIGGVFKESKGSKIYLWVTADERCIPVQVKSKVAIGYFVGELVSIEGGKQSKTVHNF